MLLDDRKSSPISTDVDEVGTTLLLAADYMEQHGWCQKERRDSLGRVCLLGAICEVIDKDDNMRLRLSAEKRIKWLTGGISLTSYNDFQITSQAEAVALLRKAAYER